MERGQSLGRSIAKEKGVQPGPHHSTDRQVWWMLVNDTETLTRMKTKGLSDSLGKRKYTHVRLHGLQKRLGYRNWRCQPTHPRQRSQHRKVFAVWSRNQWVDQWEEGRGETTKHPIFRMIREVTGARATVQPRCRRPQRKISSFQTASPRFSLMLFLVTALPISKQGGGRSWLSNMQITVVCNFLSIPLMKSAARTVTGSDIFQPMQMQHCQQLLCFTHAISWSTWSISLPGSSRALQWMANDNSSLRNKN